MLVQLGVNESLAKCHSIASRIPGGIVSWTGAKYEVVEEESKTKTIGWTSLLALGSFLYGLNAHLALKSGDLAMSTLCGVFTVGAGALAATLPDFRHNAPDCASFLNGLLKIAEDRKRDILFREALRSQSLLKLLARLLIIAQIAYPWAFSLAALTWNCSPLNMLSSMMPWCDDGAAGKHPSSNAGWTLEICSRFGIGIIHVSFWKALFSQGIMDAVHLVLGSLCQKSLVQHLAKRADVDGNNNKFPLNLYQSCQLLNTCFVGYSSSVVFALVAIILTGEISVTYLVFRILGGGSSLPLLIKGTMLTICPILFLFHMAALGEAARVHTLSEAVLTRAKQRQAATGSGSNSSKLSRRQVRSLWSLKIKLGDYNFIEGSTTLAMLDFSLRRVVDLVLIGK